MRADQVTRGDHVTVPLVGAGVVCGVEDHVLVHTLPAEVSPRPTALFTAVRLLRVESPWSLVQEVVETLATLAFVVEEATEEILLMLEALSIQLESQVAQSPALVINFSYQHFS